MGELLGGGCEAAFAKIGTERFASVFGKDPMKMPERESSATGERMERNRLPQVSFDGIQASFDGVSVVIHFAMEKLYKTASGWSLDYSCENRATKVESWRREKASRKAGLW
jgi:hypothetical protein